MTLDLTPNYWASLATIAVPIVLLTLLGVLVIRFVGRAAERRLANSALVSNEEAVDASAVRAGLGMDAAPGEHSASKSERSLVNPSRPLQPQGQRTPARTTVPITYRDLPPFVRRRRSGESFTEFSRRIGL